MCTVHHALGGAIRCDVNHFISGKFLLTEDLTGCVMHLSRLLALGSGRSLRKETRDMRRRQPNTPTEPRLSSRSVISSRFR